MRPISLDDLDTLLAEHGEVFITQHLVASQSASSAGWNSLFDVLNCYVGLHPVLLDGLTVVLPLFLVNTSMVRKRVKGWG
jgi:hypothetical protein